MLTNKNLDIIWNISLICPWDCKFCCTDAVQVLNIYGNIVKLKERNLQHVELLYRSNRELSIYDLALQNRQQRGLEISLEQKYLVLDNLSGYNPKIDFAGGDPLACYENYLIIKEASNRFGKENISITSTGAFVNKYGIDHLSNIIGVYEFTFDEDINQQPVNRPTGYNISNLKIANKFAKNGVKTKAQLPIHNGNFADNAIEQIYLTLSDNNIDELLLMRTFPVGRGSNDYQSTTFNLEFYKKVVQKFRELESKYGGTKIRLQCALKMIDNYKHNENPCDLMKNSFGINWIGQLLVSAWANGLNNGVISEDFILGDISRFHFDDIKRTEKFIRYSSKLDNNFGHCKVFSYYHSPIKNEDSLFLVNDPLYM